LQCHCNHGPGNHAVTLQRPGPEATARGRAAPRRSTTVSVQYHCKGPLQYDCKAMPGVIQ